MKTYIVLLFALTGLVIIGASRAEAQRPLTGIIDDFDEAPTFPGKKYPRHARTELGYDIYYERATVRLSHIDKSVDRPGDKALRVEYDLPPAFSWGNWASVRREFASPKNLQEYKGLEFRLRVDVPSSEGSLRLTLADITEDSRGGDELWWFDIDKNALKSKTSKWAQIRISFARFFASYGEGTRHNDGKLNLKKIIGYEINFLSKPGKHAKGVIALDSLRAYK